MVESAVQNDGSGSGVSTRTEIFELFRRLRSHENKYSCGGIGLAAVRRIIDRHRGQIGSSRRPAKDLPPSSILTLSAA